MKLTIDNLDGLGPLDYTFAIPANAKGGNSLKIQRGLNVPPRCSAEVVVGALDLALPVRHAHVVVTDDAGTQLFTGYLATEPIRVYAGETTSGTNYRAQLNAVSDEWLLDKLGSGASPHNGIQLPLNAHAALTTLAERVQSNGSAGITVATGAATAPLGAFAPAPAAPWSENAGNAASAAYANYRALGGIVSLQPAGSVTHALNDTDGTLSIAALQTSQVRELANDVTLTGEEEPAAYITECFQGDGSTTAFELSSAAFRNSTGARTLLRDSFNEATFDATQWTVADPGSHLSITSAGLTLNGGNGTDGATTLTALDAIEMSGGITAQLSGVLLNASSDGLLAGFYSGPSLLANCFAGFRVRQQVTGSSSTTVIVPVINGAETGAIFTPLAGHAYTLRLRLHCVEMQRVPQRYSCMVDGVVQTFGSASGINAPMDIVFELIDEGAASNTPATLLYDSATATATIGAIPNTPATCAFIAVNSTNLFGSVASISITRPGSLWVVSTLPGGARQTRLVGLAGTGCDCEVTYGAGTGTTGKATFFAGRVPVAGERIAVLYRSSQRSVARLEDAASVAAEATSGAPGTCRWLGKVLQPIARSSADCENAAQALLAFASSRTAAVAGTYTCINPAADIWPGDILAITSAGITSSLLVRSVAIEDGYASPETVNYKIAFANDWAAEYADGLGLKVSESIAADAILPPTAATAPAQVLANLQQMSITSLTTTTLALNAGTTPPTGGGFEVRRTDWQFGANIDAADLVLRSPVANFSIPRAAQIERFYIRMYDSTGLYSRFSTAIFINWPVS